MRDLADPRRMGPVRRPEVEDFLAWLLSPQTLRAGEALDVCVDWRWATTAGYGVLGWERRLRRVSHIALEGSGRPRPEAPSNQALHSCHRPICCAPWHLRWGTHQENMADRLACGHY